MLQRFRVAMVRAEREPLSGDVEVDETFVGGVDHGRKRGRGARKCIVVVALELHVPKGFGRVRLRHVPDASGDSLVPFVCETVAPGSVVLTDAWGGYNDLAKHPYTHKAVSLSASPDPAHVVMPGVHRVASLLKRWVLGTHQGSIDPAHLQTYLEVLLRWPGASVTSVGAKDPQWRTGSLEVTATLPSPHFSPSASSCVGTYGSVAAESPTSVTQNVRAEQVFSR